MGKIKTLILATGLIISCSSEAGLFKTTVHSRANCLNNESITWWAGHPYSWKVVTIHKHHPTRIMHMFDTGYQYKDRVAAICWGEGVHAGYEVWGYHYLEGWMGNMYFDATQATTCSIIDGW